MSEVSSTGSSSKGNDPEADEGEASDDSTTFEKGDDAMFNVDEDQIKAINESGSIYVKANVADKNKDEPVSNEE